MFIHIEPELFTKRCSPKKCAVKKHTIELIS